VSGCVRVCVRACVRGSRGIDRCGRAVRRQHVGACRRAAGPEAAQRTALQQCYGLGGERDGWRGRGGIQDGGSPLRQPSPLCVVDALAASCGCPRSCACRYLDEVLLFDATAATGTTTTTAGGAAAAAAAAAAPTATAAFRKLAPLPFRRSCLGLATLFASGGLLAFGGGYNEPAYNETARCAGDDVVPCYCCVRARVLGCARAHAGRLRRRT
jgi:hypothetical protein